MSQSPSQHVDRLLSADSAVTPLGTVDLGANNGSYTATLNKATVEGIGLEQGDELHVGYDPATRTFLIRASEDFDGW